MTIFRSCYYKLSKNFSFEAKFKVKFYFKLRSLKIFSDLKEIVIAIYIAKVFFFNIKVICLYCLKTLFSVFEF